MEGDLDELLKRLTPRQRDIVNLVEKGFNNREIANSLHISERTVQKYLERSETCSILDRLGLDKRENLVAQLYECRLISLKHAVIRKDLDEFEQKYLDTYEMRIAGDNLQAKQDAEN